MRYELKSIPYWPFTRLAFVLNLIGGFLMGLVYAMFAGFFLTVMSQLPMYQDPEFQMDSLPVGVLVVVLPFLFAIFSAFFNTLIGLVIVFMYNLGARFLGGFEMNFELVPVYEQRQSPQRPMEQHLSSPPQFAAPPPPPPYRPAPPPQSTPPDEQIPPGAPHEHGGENPDYQEPRG